MRRRRRGRQVRAVPTNCKFHALRQAEASQQLRAIAAVAMSCRFWAGRRCRLDRRRVGLTKAPAEQGKGLGGKTDGRSTTEEREGGETRAREAQSKRGRAVAAATDPSRPVRSRRNISARAGSGLHLAVFLCASFYTGGSGRNAAATQRANDAFIQLKWAAPRRNRSSSRRRRRSAIFESSSSGSAAVGSSARSMSC